MLCTPTDPHGVVDTKKRTHRRCQCTSCRPEVGKVALRQALRACGVTYFRIAELTGVSTRTAWHHVGAKEGSNVLPWERRHWTEQEAALAAAKKLLS